MPAATTGSKSACADRCCALQHRSSPPTHGGKLPSLAKPDQVGKRTMPEPGEIHVKSRLPNQEIQVCRPHASHCRLSPSPAREGLGHSYMLACLGWPVTDSAPPRARSVSTGIAVTAQGHPRPNPELTRGAGGRYTLGGSAEFHLLCQTVMAFIVRSPDNESHDRSAHPRPVSPKRGELHESLARFSWQAFPNSPASQHGL